MNSRTVATPKNKNSTISPPVFGKKLPERIITPESANEVRDVSDSGFGHNFGSVQVENQTFKQSCPLSLPGPAHCPYGGACHTCPPRIQKKLKIGKPGDKYEQEADRIVDQVMRMPDLEKKVSISNKANTNKAQIQRTCAECKEEEEEEAIQTKPIAGQITPLVQRQEEMEEEEEEETLQTKPLGDQTTPLIQRQTELDEEEEENEDFVQARHEYTGSQVVSADIASGVRTLGGQGRPLDAVTRAYFEPRFGHELGQVRVHAGSNASTLVRSVRAKAFTFGRHIVFGSGQLSPGSHEGRKLLAHELTHVIQQGRAPALHLGSHRLAGAGMRAPAIPISKVGGATQIQRRITPIEGRKSVCKRPPSPRRLGVAVHDKIQEKFLKGGMKKRKKELSLPFTDTTACKVADSDRWQKPTSRGRPDLAILEKSREKVKVKLGEIKPYNVKGMSAGVGVMLCYAASIKRNADLCKQKSLQQLKEVSEGNDPNLRKKARKLLKGTDSAMALSFCDKLDAWDRDIELGSPIGWQPGVVSVSFRTGTHKIVTANIGGVIGYACPDMLKKKSKKKDKDKRKKKSKAKSKGKGMKPKPKAGKALKEAKGALKKTGKGALKKLGKGALKKVIPGEAYLELGIIAAVLLAGGKPAFAGEGMAPEEALVDIVKHGPPPNVNISEDMKKLLEANPELMERMRKLEKGEGDRDAAAKAGLKLLEDNKDLIDAESLEALVEAMEHSKRPDVKQGSKEFRKTLEAIKSGAKPGTGESSKPKPGGTGAKDKPGAVEPEGEAKTEKKETAKEGTKGEGGEAGTGGGRIPEKMKKEIESNESRKELFKLVVTKMKEKGTLTKAEAKRFLDATRALKEEQLKKILSEVAKLPKADEKTPEDKPTEGALTVIERMAKALQAGKQLPTPATEGSPSKPQAPTKKQMAYIKKAMRSLRKIISKNPRTKTIGRTVFARPRNMAKAIELGVGGGGSGGYAQITKSGFVGTYASLKIKSIEKISKGRTRITWEITGSTLLVDEKGNVVGQPLDPGTEIITTGKMPKSRKREAKQRGRTK
ncbi:MAG: DUF4157 domain-containing protein [Candidatus Scalindua sp. AMX11]|nr:DUF4157 domain-containing protein [Planctomycetota bacterium]RZV61691.1 MAG: DUF4157 domain-containing protein [Candidatus Scalindua sp. SCAELEC01]TDE63229.1 MAG: DUF4157 domain-containing protein [Candidatus Scalindua sp. AMX11]